MHDPSQDGHVVGCDGKTGHDDSQADAFGMFMDAIEGDDNAATVCLANRDFQNEDWNTEEEEGDEIWDEPLEAVVREDHRWVPQKITQANSAALFMTES
ncbi:MAG: hypothetical protein Q9192_008404, partial [Flavoplaca navasiana]